MAVRPALKAGKEQGTDEIDDDTVLTSLMLVAEGEGQEREALAPQSTELAGLRLAARVEDAGGAAPMGIGPIGGRVRVRGKERGGRKQGATHWTSGTTTGRNCTGWWRDEGRKPQIHSSAWRRTKAATMREGGWVGGYSQRPAHCCNCARK
ncbi:hypothetical protein BDZ91DRAFT_766888 [Kalaharituber pfeilii]|nr:hypothetical protein BDZ91DRAFT_766888 [Kalaharituber pfeilii]